MKATVLLILLASSAQASECFDGHLVDAIALNRQRKPLYAELTGGRSLRVSRTLINYERLARVTAKWMEFRARHHRRAGIGLLCDEFVSMDRVPTFKDRDIRPVTERFQSNLDLKALLNSLRNARKRGDFGDAAAVAENWIARIERAPGYHCMLRHVLESIRRAANLGPEHVRAATVRGLESPEDISWDFITLQAKVLGNSHELDAWAAPLQAQGFPILCQDVPPIPPR